MNPHISSLAFSALVVVLLGIKKGVGRIVLTEVPEVPNFQHVVGKGAGLERYGLEDELPPSMIPSMFDHGVRNSSTIQSNYQVTHIESIHCDKKGLVQTSETV